MTNTIPSKTYNLSVLRGRETNHLDNRRPFTIQVVSGAAYITQEGDHNDYIVKSGENLNVETPGLVVIQGWPNVEYAVNG